MMKLRTRTWQIVLACVVLVAAQFIVYRSVLNNEFLRYDDDTYVYENDNIKTLNAETVAWMFARPYFRSYTPLTLLSHAIDYKNWGENPHGHHLSSLVLHSIDVVLVFFLGIFVIHLGRLTPEDRRGISKSLLKQADTPTLIGAFVAALFFSVHPTRVESVAWISDRKDLLLVLFMIPTILFYIEYDARRGTKTAVRWYLLSLLLFILALLSKSIAIATPVVLILLDGMLLHPHDWRERMKALALEKTPFFILSVGFGILAMGAAQGAVMSDIVTRLSSTERLVLPLYTIAFYPLKILWPAQLTPIYGSPGLGLMALASVITVAISWFAIVKAKKGRWLWLLAWSSYVVLIMPTITGLPAGIQPWADRYSYVPVIGLMLLLGGGISVLWQQSAPPARRLIGASCAALAAVLVYLSVMQVSVWKDSMTLWRYAVSVVPGVPMSYANLGVAMADKGDTDSALVMYSKAINLEPKYADALYDKAIAFETKDMTDSAVAFYVRAIQADNEYIDAYVNLGNIFVRDGRIEDGINLYQHALKLKPSDPDAHYDLGFAYYQQGDTAKALASFQDAIRYSPNYASAYNNMGVVLAAMGRNDAALASFVRAAQLGSEDARKLLTSKGYSW
jgi:protein O-mannosyl-transferase